MVHVIRHRAVSAILQQEIRHKTTTKKPFLHLTIEELEVLLPLASDQLFRNEFIDIRIPGFEQNREKLQSAKAVVSRIKERLHQAQQQTAIALRLSIRYP
ncbi:MAG TPA: hypothetical protein VEU11_01100 [Terriglobales bacterium]|nr:hypothetical protein [Terriglobales bacterium]